MKQAAASVGQCQMMSMYDRLFAEYNQSVGQILLTGDDVEVESRAEHLSNTFSALLEMGIIPIVNENIMNNFPQIIPLLEKLGSKLSDDIMRELNYLVDTKGEAPKDVAYNFLKDNSLI